VANGNQRRPNMIEMITVLLLRGRGALRVARPLGLVPKVWKDLGHF